MKAVAVLFCEVKKPRCPEEEDFDELKADLKKLREEFIAKNLYIYNRRLI